MLLNYTHKSALVHFATVLLGLGACSADLATPESEAEKPDVSKDAITVDADGVLHFDSPETFFATIGTLSKLSPAELDAWEDSRGFVSYRREFETVMRQVSGAATEDISNTLLKRNADIVGMENDRLVPRLQAFGYRALTPRSGLFYVDGTIHKVTPELVVTARDGKRETVEHALVVAEQQDVAATATMSTPAPGVRVVRYARPESADSSTLSGCTERVSAFFNTSSRKVDISLNTRDYYCEDCCGNYYHQIFVDGRMSGYRKKTIGKGWTQDSYNTSYYYDSLEFQVYAPWVHGFYPDPSTGRPVSNYTSELLTGSVPATESPGDWQNWGMNGSWTIGHQVQNTSISAPYFERVKVRGKSRGTGDGGWAEICCGYDAGCGF
jgi:hypothetical protein